MDFDNCIKPEVNAVNMAYYISEYYKYWRDAYMKPSGSTTGGYYIYAQGTGGPGTVTVSEAQGYGMIVFALMSGTGTYADPEAKKYFDGMFKFFQAHPCRNSSDLMSWQVLDDGSGGEVSYEDVTATDGDLDIAYALVLAHYQWGSNGSINYLQEAKNVISAIKRYEINQDNKRVMLCDNSDWPNHFQRNQSRCSDWMAGHFQTYYEVTGDSFWNSVSSTVYSMYNQLSSSYSPQTGLVPDFIDGQTPAPYSYAGKTHYSFDACRFPWRIAADFLHHGTSSAKTVCNKITTWLIDETSGDPANIMAEYQLNGTPIGDYNSTAFTSPFLVACMADKSAISQSFLNKGWNEVKLIKEDYYEDTINLLCMLLMSGNWWKPEPYTEINNQNEGNLLTNTHLKIIPNANNKSFSLSYSLPKSDVVKIGLYTLNGQLVQLLANEYQSQGNHNIKASFTNSSLSKGAYIISFITSDNSQYAKFNFID
jgi:endo-1,4-beta-D-glucanase Y